jgi:hypothetical protein
MGYWHDNTVHLQERLSGARPVAGWIFTAAIVFIGIAYIISERDVGKMMTARFADRESLDFEEFYANYYKNSLDKRLVKELIEHVAHELSVPACKLRPEDSFEHELKPPSGSEFDSGKSILFLELAHLAKAKGKVIDLDEIKTLDDYLNAMTQVY